MMNGVSERLRTNKGKIMDRWHERAKKDIAAALHQDRLTLDNALGIYVDQIVIALSLEVPKTENQIRIDREQLAQFARGHGEARAGLKSYTIESMIYEFHILRQTICDVLEEEEPLDARSREIITSIIEQGVNDAVSRYNQILRGIKERLTATLVHDLRNPIAAAQMAAQMTLRQSARQDLCESNAKRIVHSLDRVSLMIEDVLDASRLVAGEALSLKIDDCNLEDLVRHLVENYNQASLKQVQLIVDGAVVGKWDARALERIVENLLTNAIKYGDPQEAVTITLKEMGEHVVLAVHNRGPSITAADQELLFQKFSRTKSAESKSGWGLGLIIVKGLAEAHGGRVEVRSTPEEGTTFLVTLPKNGEVASHETPPKKVG